MLADLQKNGLLALTQTKEVGTGYHSKGALRKEKPEAIIEAIYDLGELNEVEKRLLSVFALLPAENIAFHILEGLLQGFEELTETLLDLSQKGWLDYNEVNKSFKISPVIQEVSMNKNPPLFEDSKNLIYNLTEKLLYESDTGNFINVSSKEASLYARYAESIVNNFEQADYNLAILCERLGNYYKTSGTLLKALNFMRNLTY